MKVYHGTFFRQHPSPNSEPSSANPALFKKLGFLLSTKYVDPGVEKPPPGPAWCIMGPSKSGKTSFLEMLRGGLICVPPTARSYNPILDQKSIRYAGFDTAHRGGGLGKLSSTYLAERYESRQEGTDFTLRDYLLDNTELNPLSIRTLDADSQKLFDKVVAGLKLGSLLDLPVSFLSNGQGRRAAIAHALLHRPRVLLLDEPFMGLDPPTVSELSNMLSSFNQDAAPLAEDGHQSPSLVITLRPQDPLPTWITHLGVLTTNSRMVWSGLANRVLKKLDQYIVDALNRKVTERPNLPLSLFRGRDRIVTKEGIEEGSRRGHSQGALRKELRPGVLPAGIPRGERVVEMQGCVVKYGEKAVLGNWEGGLHWTVREGERWGVFGPNGSGKTTLVSLLCSDHPQTYSLPIKLFGRSRLPDSNSTESPPTDPTERPPTTSIRRPLTYWDIQERIGHSSPEVHQHMPRGLSIRQVLESAWADTFRSKPKLDDWWAVPQINATLSWFSPEINPGHRPLSSKKSQPESVDWADKYLFGELSFSAQRVLLFLRAIIKHPKIVVLDEAFSGMDVEVRDKCMSWLEEGSRSAPVNGQQKFIVRGLRNHQALICISHVKEEVPDCVTQFLYLPEANTGLAARAGKVKSPLRWAPWKEWERIWDPSPPLKE
ncbi:P-loop containing nucleoside triphosphate hydrolase protein [Naviculisporaceae sp. PSN 640]